MTLTKPRLVRLGVQRVEDPHPRRYRELRSPAEMRKLLNCKVRLQAGICIVALLRDLQTRASEHNLCPEAHDLVFKTAAGQPISADYLAKHFKSILDLAGLPRIRLYDLRHSAATIALAAGVWPKVVSEQLGHASTAFTLDTYAHVLPHMQGEAAARIEAMLFGERAYGS